MVTLLLLNAAVSALVSICVFHRMSRGNSQQRLLADVLTGGARPQELWKDGSTGSVRRWRRSDTRYVLIIAIALILLGTKFLSTLDLQVPQLGVQQTVRSLSSGASYGPGVASHPAAAVITPAAKSSEVIPHSSDSPDEAAIRQRVVEGINVYFEIVQCDSVRMFGDSMIAGGPPRALVVQASLEEVLKKHRQTEKEKFADWQQEVARVQNDSQIAVEKRKKLADLWKLYLDLKQAVDVPGVFTPTKYNDLTARHKVLFSLPAVPVLTSAGALVNESATDVKFFDANRNPPYLASLRSGHAMRSAAIQALADDFLQTPEWVETHMGASNNLFEIHKRLNGARIQRASSPLQGAFRASGNVQHGLVGTLKQAWQREGYSRRSKAEKLQAILLMQLAIDEVPDKADREATLDHIQREIGSW